MPWNRALSGIRDEALKTGITQLFSDAQQLIDQERIDVVVLAARRLACLYELLVREGMPRLHGASVLSDRFLDVGYSEPQGGVLILDDSVVVGTTLTRLYDDIAGRWPHVEIRTKSIVVDSEQRAGYLLEDLNFTALHERGSKEVRSFSAEIAACLFQAQIPLFSDFVTTKLLTLPNYSWQEYISNPGWRVADVTAPLLQSSETRAFTQIPTDETRDRYLAKLEPAVAELIEAFKVRTYVRYLGADVCVVFVPIAILGPVTLEELDECFHSLPEPFREIFGSRWQQCTPSVKHRIVQMYASVCALAEAWGGGQNAMSLGMPKPDDFNATQLEIYFGEMADAAIGAIHSVIDNHLRTPVESTSETLQLMLSEPSPSELLEMEDIRALLYNTRELLAYVGRPVQPAETELVVVGLVFAHAVSSVFGYIDAHHESAQRKQIIELANREQYERWSNEGRSRILNQGFTVRELTEGLAPDCLDGDSWSASLVTLGIDMGNDLGIIVPVTRYDDEQGVAYRSFRLGETAYLAERPLASVIQETRPRFDVMSRSGHPPQIEVRPIADAFGPARTAGQSALDELVLIVIRAIPGRPVQCFDGTVTSVDEGTFEAHVVDPVRRGADEFVRMSRTQVAEGEQSRIKPRADFTWTVFERDSGEVKDRTSRVRFWMTWPISLRAMQAAAESSKVRKLLQSDE